MVCTFVLSICKRTSCPKNCSNQLQKGIPFEGSQYLADIVGVDEGDGDDNQLHCQVAGDPFTDIVLLKLE